MKEKMEQMNEQFVQRALLLTRVIKHSTFKSTNTMKINFTVWFIKCSTNTSRISFNADETMAPNRGSQ